MPSLPENAHSSANGSSSEMTASEAVHSVMRLGRTFMYRKHVVLWSVAVTLAIGLAYFATAPRYYRSAAKLWIMERHADDGSTMGDQIANENLLATQRDLVLSPKVVQHAVDNLSAEYQVDLQQSPQNEHEAAHYSHGQIESQFQVLVDAVKTEVAVERQDPPKQNRQG